MSHSYIRVQIRLCRVLCNTQQTEIGEEVLFEGLLSRHLYHWLLNWTH